MKHYFYVPQIIDDISVWRIKDDEGNFTPDIFVCDLFSQERMERIVRKLNEEEKLPNIRFSKHFIKIESQIVNLKNVDSITLREFKDKIVGVFTFRDRQEILHVFNNIELAQTFIETCFKCIEES